MADETKTAVQNSLREAGQTSDGGKGSTSREAPPPTYTKTQEDVDKAINDALARAGRDAKSLETWEKSLKSKEASLSGLEQEREDIKTQLAELAEQDPDKFNVVQKSRELKNKEMKLKEQEATLNTSIAEHEAVIKKASAWEFSQMLTTIVVEYEGLTAEKLLTACTKLGITDEAKARDLAETIGTKKAVAEQPRKPSPNPVDSGKTSGGGDNLASLSPGDRVKEADRRLRKK